MQRALRSGQVIGDGPSRASVAPNTTNANKTERRRANLAARARDQGEIEAWPAIGFLGAFVNENRIENPPRRTLLAAGAAGRLDRNQHPQVGEGGQCVSIARHRPRCYC